VPDHVSVQHGGEIAHDAATPAPALREKAQTHAIICNEQRSLPACMIVFKPDLKNTRLPVDERVAQRIDHEFGYREQQRPAPFSWQRQRLDIQR
jgi:hypothetical protein